MEKEAILRALQEAVIDYNTWAKEQNRLHNSNSNELRGIFYNKLVARLRLVDGFSEMNKDPYGRLLEPDDFAPTFTISGIMKGLQVVMWARHQFRTGTKHKFLISLKDLAQLIVYEELPDNSYYEIASIVEKIKAFKI